MLILAIGIPVVTNLIAVAAAWRSATILPEDMQNERRRKFCTQYLAMWAGAMVFLVIFWRSETSGTNHWWFACLLHFLFGGIVASILPARNLHTPPSA
jgi:hypothetical protein